MRFIDLQEGPNDPGIFKAVFFAGGPGSGKSYVANQLGLISRGLKVLNSDDALEFLMRKHDLSFEMPPEEQPQRDVVRQRAKELTKKKQDIYLSGRLGLIIDGTAKDVDKMAKLKTELEAIGYQTMMVFVNTSLKTALQRNLLRDRKVPTDIVTQSHKQVQLNKDRLTDIFAPNFVEVANDDNPDFNTPLKRIDKFLDAPITSQARDWISKASVQKSIAQEDAANNAKVIYRLDKEAPMDDTEVLVLGGAGRYTLAGLRNKARKEAEALAKDLEVEHGGAFRKSAYNVKQLSNTLNTVVAAYDELNSIRKGGGTRSKGIRNEDVQGKPKVYVDMDGVLANFYAGVTTATGHAEPRELALQDMEDTMASFAGTDFFYKLPKYEQADQLIAMVNKMTNGDWYILSSPLKYDREGSAKWKAAWVKKYLNIQPKGMHFTGDKAQFATQPDGTPNILIDDYPKYLSSWTEKGGIGVKYKGHVGNIEDVKATLDKYLGTRVEEENKPRTAKALIYQTDMYGAKGYYGQCKEPGCDYKTKTYDRAVQAQNAIKKHHQDHFKDVKETIRKVKGGYRLVSKSGKNLGTYPSKAGAEKRERQVQYFKHMGEQGRSTAVEPHEPGYQHSLLTAPQNTLVIDKSDDMDFYKLGQHYTSLAHYDKHELGVGPSDMTITFASPEEMERMKKVLDKLGVKYKDISGSHEEPEIHTKETTKPNRLLDILDEITEKRRNPERNMKSGSGKYDLINYAEDNISDTDNWAVSMTMEPKLGINPKGAVSEDTPKGIYFYPLQYFKQMADRDQPLPWADNFPYIQLFQYDRSGEMTKQTKVDPARLKQALLQYCPEEVIQQAIEEGDYDGTPYWFIYDCLSRLGKGDETNVIRWNKVLRDLGFTSVFDDGDGWIAYNEPTQGVVLDPRIIKQHKTFSNRNPKLERRRYDIQGLADSIGYNSYYQRELQLNQIRTWDNPANEEKVRLAVAKTMLKQFLGKSEKEAAEMGYKQALQVAADKVIEILKSKQTS